MNLKVRIKNPAFWATIIPAVLIAVQAILAPLGVTFNFEELSGQLVTIADAVLAILAIVGVTADFTTPGIKDSDRAMGYTAPGVNGDEAVG